MKGKKDMNKLILKVTTMAITRKFVKICQACVR